MENPVHCPSLEMKFLNKMHFPYQIFQKGEWGDDASIKIIIFSLESKTTPMRFRLKETICLFKLPTKSICSAGQCGWDLQLGHQCPPTYTYIPQLVLQHLETYIAWRQTKQTDKQICYSFDVQQPHK